MRMETVGWKIAFWYTPRKFNSSPLKIGNPKKETSLPNHQFSGAILNLGGVYINSILCDVFWDG